MADLRVPGKALPEIVVHGEVEATVEPTHLLVQPAAPEHRRLRNIVVVEHQDESIESGFLFRAQVLPGVVDPERVSIGRVYIRVRIEKGGYLCKRTWQQQVVR